MATQEKRNDKIVGLFLLIGLSVIGALIIGFGDLSDKIKGTYTVEVMFSDASGLIKGSEIRLGGAKVGAVKGKPYLSEGKTAVEIKIDHGVRIPDNALFQISTINLLGDKAVVVTLPEVESEDVLKEGSVVLGGGAGGLESIQSDAVAIARDARDLITDAKTTLLKVDTALDDIRSVAGRLSVTVETINSGILDAKNVENVASFLGNMEETSRSLKESTRSLKPLLHEASLAVREIRETTQETQGFIVSASQQLTPALKEIPSAISSIRETSEKAGRVVQRFEEGEGLIGSLASDREMDGDAKTFVKNLRRHGILGYRDAEIKEDDPRERFRGRRR